MNKSVSREDIKNYHNEWLSEAQSQFHNINLNIFACSICISYMKVGNNKEWFYYRLPEKLEMDSETFSIYKEWWRLGETDVFNY